MMKAERAETNFEPLPEGSYPVRLYSIVMIGTETGEYQGKPISSKKVRLTFELPTELKEFKEGDGEKPHVLSREFNFSMHPKSKLKPFVESWLGNFKNEEAAYDLDFESLIGKTGLASVAHNIVKDKTYPNLSAIVPLPKAMECPEAINTPFILSYENWDQAAFDTLPEWIQERMMETPEYKTLKNEGEEIDIDEVPAF